MLHVAISGLIDIFLAIMTRITLQVLQKQVKEKDTTFRKEICMIQLIFWTFFVTYSLGFAYNLLMVIFPRFLDKRTRFEDELLDIICFNVFDLIPIMVIMIAHFKSYSSINKILRLVMNQRKEIDGILDD